ncbi:hypothetical protein ACFLXT_03365 [Chloroflexota bacterium]
MSKLAPEDLWRRHTLERFEAFKQSGKLEELRKEGLAACGRKKRFTSLEWFKSPMRKRYSSPRYMEWYHKCEAVAQRFGLAPWTVVSACLISGYQPDKAGLVVESEWPQIRVITESTDDQFLARSAYEAQLRGLYAISRQGSVETTRLFLNPVPISYMEPPPIPSSMPPPASAFHMRVETPVGYSPEAAKKLQKAANELGKDILTALGYSIPKRLRTSRLVSKADDLRIAENRLPRRGLYEIVADTFDESSVSEDEQRRKTVKTQRYRLRKRLIKPYE